MPGWALRPPAIQGRGAYTHASVVGLRQSRIAEEAAVKYVMSARWRLFSADLVPPTRVWWERRKWLSAAESVPCLESVQHRDGYWLMADIQHRMVAIKDLSTPEDVAAAGSDLIGMVDEVVRRAQCGQIDARGAIEAFRSRTPVPAAA